jgi:DMSO/TMAO reductase YedYZ heme-binding membrane subunit
METIMTEQVTTKNSAASVITMTLVLSIGYAVLRYHIVGPVPWTDFPFFILNKGLCLAAFVLLTMNFALGPLNNLGVSVGEGWLNARKAMGMTGFLLVMLHALMSFLLFSPAVYSKFFYRRRYSDIAGGPKHAGRCDGFRRTVGLQHDVPDIPS